MTQDELTAKATAELATELLNAKVAKLKDLLEAKSRHERNHEKDMTRFNEQIAKVYTAGNRDALIAVGVNY